jgi:multiple antibiotic resistance protein
LAIARSRKLADIPSRGGGAVPNAFGTSFITMLVLLDPFGNVPTFLSLTERQSHRARNGTALVAIMSAAAILGVFAGIGESLLAYLKITIEDVQVAGGIVLLIVALQMIGGAEEQAGADDANVAVVPLGTPLLAGPGTIVALLVLLDEYRAITGRVEIAAGTLLALAAVYGAFRFASEIADRVKPGLSRALNRVVGLLVAAIAVHFIASAVGEWFHNGVR